MNQPENRVERVAAAAVTSLTPPPRAVPVAFGWPSCCRLAGGTYGRSSSSPSHRSRCGYSCRTTKTIPCNDGYLSVSGVTNTITVTGHCTSVSVSGYRIPVTIDSTDAISASGTGNVVTDHWGSPRIANAGTSNSILQG